MGTYLHPGVYVEEIPSGAKPIEAVATSVTAFVGQVPRGEVGKPLLIHSWGDYVSEFGGVTSETDTMGLAVRSYYLNGGKDAYICRLASSDPKAVAASSKVAGQGVNPAETDVIQVSANSAGELTGMNLSMITWCLK